MDKRLSSPKSQTLDTVPFSRHAGISVTSPTVATGKHIMRVTHRNSMASKENKFELKSYW